MPRDPAQQLRDEPGIFGTRLRSRARRRRSQILVFVDQFEELYTLVGDATERAAFTACLASAGDDPGSPLRVVVSMRSDFLDRAAEDRRFLDELTRGLVFLQPPDRAGLEEALLQPVEMLGYKFEDGIVSAMLDTLEHTPGPLPLLQFSAAKLWALRDKQRRVLTRDAYLAMGGVAGALATHADEVLATFTASDQKVVRSMFQRLVTPERTRAVVETRELREIAPDVERLIGRLVEARLLVVQQRGADSAVELVHESLIRSWPTLQHWLEENQEHAAYLQQIAVAAKAWDAKGRPAGMLWTGEAMDEARLFSLRFRGQLPAREHAFLAAVNALATRAATRKRRLVFATIAILSLFTAAAVAALLYIRQQQHIAESRRIDAEVASKLATQQAIAAKEAKELAQREAQRAVDAETDARAKFDQLAQALQARDAATMTATRNEVEKRKAEKVAKQATAKAKMVVEQSEADKARAAAAALEADRKREEARKKREITNVLK